MNHKPKTIYLKTCFFFLAISVVAAVVLRMHWPVELKSLKEAVGMLILCLVLVSFKPVQQLIQNIPKLHFRIFLAIFFLSALAQYIHRPMATFPFTPWSMYGNVFTKDHMDYVDYEGVDAKGNHFKIYPEKAFPSLWHGRILHSMDHYIRIIGHAGERLEEERPPAQGGLYADIKKIVQKIFEEPARDYYNEEKYSAFVRAVLIEYNRKHPEHPYVALEVYQGIMDLDLSNGLKVDRRRMWRVEVDDE